MKKNKISKNWINKQRRDIYVRQSRVDGYRARSAYKLIEIDEKLDLNELKKLLQEKGETEIQLILRQKDTKFTIKLENPRKFDLKLFNEVKNREYVKKITF